MAVGCRVLTRMFNKALDSEKMFEGQRRSGDSQEEERDVIGCDKDRGIKLLPDGQAGRV